MKRKYVCLMAIFILVIIYAGACAKPSGPAPAATSPSLVAPPGSTGSARASQLSPEQRWDEMVKAARKEGGLNIYSSNPAETRQRVGDAMYQKFGVEVEWVVGSGSNELVQKILAERKANVFYADAVVGGTMSTMNILKPAGLVEPLEPELVLPEVTDTTKWFQERLWWVDKERTHIAYAAIAMPAIVINTDLVRKEEMTSYRDLLNPKWKGKLLMDRPFTGGPGNTWLTAVGELIMGKDYLRELAAQEPFIIREPRIEEWVARGKYPILIGGSTGSITQLLSAGVSNMTVITPKEGTWLSQSNGAISLIKQAAHPNAARVFLNWLLSQEGQTIVCQSQGFQSARTDVPTDWIEPWSLRQPGVKYHDTINYDYQLKKQEYIEFAKKVFREQTR